MKRILTTLCALAFVMAGSIPALAAEADADTGQSASYYPISVEEYTYGSLDEPRVEKVYQLSLSDDPSGIPTEDFVRNGRLYYLLDMTRKNEVGVDTKPHIETISQASDTNDMETILQQLNAELEVTTEDGYTGILHLDHTTVKVTADGYATKTQALSASRSYPNLSEADVSLIPKSIEEKGNTLTLADVQWDSAEQTDGAGGIVTRYTATASYTGSSSYQYATGYTVTADYSGEVAKPDCDVVTYTVRHLRQHGGPGGERGSRNRAGRGLRKHESCCGSLRAEDAPAGGRRGGRPGCRGRVRLQKDQREEMNALETARRIAGRHAVYPLHRPGQRVGIYHGRPG